MRNKKQKISKYDEIDEIDREIIRVKIESPSISDSELAKRVDICRAVARKRLEKDKVQKAIETLQKSAIQVLIDAQGEAARKLVGLMRNGTEGAQIKACIEILKGVLADKHEVEVRSAADIIKSHQEKIRGGADSNG